MQKAFRTNTRKEYVHTLPRYQQLIKDELEMKKLHPNPLTTSWRSSTGDSGTAQP